jgi:hypothetical protein
MSSRLPLAVLVTLGLFAPTANAQTTDKIDARQSAQSQRIQAGVQRGTITAAELRRLSAVQSRVEQMEQRLRESGGTFTARERARVHRALHQLSRTIARAARR